MGVAAGALAGTFADHPIKSGLADKIGQALSAGMDISRDNGLVVDRDHEDKAPYAFTGTVEEVIFDLMPVHHEAEKASHGHA